MPECKGDYRQSIRDKIYNLLTPRGRVKVDIELLNLPPDRGKKRYKMLLRKYDKTPRKRRCHERDYDLLYLHCFNLSIIYIILGI